MALQVRARDTRREMDSQELLLGDGTSGKRQAGSLGVLSCRCCGALTHVDRTGLLLPAESRYSAKQEAGVRAAGMCRTSPWYSSGTGDV